MNPRFAPYHVGEKVLYCGIPATILRIDSFTGDPCFIETCEISYLTPNGVAVELLNPREFSTRVTKRISDAMEVGV